MYSFKGEGCMSFPKTAKFARGLLEYLSCTLEHNSCPFTHAENVCDVVLAVTFTQYHVLGEKGRTVFQEPADMLYDHKSPDPVFCTPIAAPGLPPESST